MIQMTEGQRRNLIISLRRSCIGNKLPKPLYGGNSQNTTKLPNQNSKNQD